MAHSICDSYPKFGAAQPRQTRIITRRKKWGRLTPPSKSRDNRLQQRWLGPSCRPNLPHRGQSPSVGACRSGWIEPSDQICRQAGPRDSSEPSLLVSWIWFASPFLERFHPFSERLNMSLKLACRSCQIRPARAGIQWKNDALPVYSWLNVNGRSCDHIRCVAGSEKVPPAAIRARQQITAPIVELAAKGPELNAHPVCHHSCYYLFAQVWILFFGETLRIKFWLLRPSGIIYLCFVYFVFMK